MAVTAQELLTAVKEVEQLAASEAQFRAVCSRAYYSIYQDGDAFHKNLPSHGLPPGTVSGGMHFRLIQQLIHPTVPRTSPEFFKSMSIGYLMQSLYAKRIKADYDRALDIDKPTAIAAVAEAAKILSTINGVLPPPPASPVTPPAQQVASVTTKPSVPKSTLTRIK